MKSLGEILREHREKKGLLLRQVAAALEIDTALLSKFERDERKPNKDQLNAFAKYYNVSPNEMMVALLSDKVIHDIAKEEFATEVLRAAEEKLEHIKKKNKSPRK